jgi:hypothetical protein
MNKELLNNLYTIQDGLGNIYLANFVKTDKGVDTPADLKIWKYVEK